MSHSKRNTSRAVFTSYERNLAKDAWSASTARLGRDSFLPFASCCLCLRPATTPVSCLHGDIFCRECALSNILSQKREIKRLEKQRLKEAEEALEYQIHEDEEAQARAVLEFERVQMGLGASGGGGKKEGRGKVDSGLLDDDDDGKSDAKRGEKRKFELDDEELVKIAKEDRSKARKAIDSEKAAKPTLPSFWVPSITPTSNTTTALHKVTKPPKSHPICPASKSDSPHSYALKTLLSINFTTEETSDTKTLQSICPSCKKVLSNTSKAVLMKPCGHVLCRGCVDRLRVTEQRERDDGDDVVLVTCYVCDADLTERKKGEGGEGKEKDGKIGPGMVDLVCEGMGFAGGGANKVKKDGVVFQC